MTLENLKFAKEQWERNAENEELPEGDRRRAALSAKVAGERYERKAKRAGLKPDSKSKESHSEKSKSKEGS